MIVLVKFSYSSVSSIYGFLLLVRGSTLFFSTIVKNLAILENYALSESFIEPDNHPAIAIHKVLSQASGGLQGISGADFTFISTALLDLSIRCMTMKSPLQVYPSPIQSSPASAAKKRNSMSTL